MQRRRQSLHGGLLQKTIALIFLSLLLVSGDQKEEKVKVAFGTNNSHLPPNVQEKQHQNPQQKQSLRYFSSKRRVPNASDPLHNR